MTEITIPESKNGKLEIYINSGKWVLPWGETVVVTDEVASEIKRLIEVMKGYGLIEQDSEDGGGDGDGSEGDDLPITNGSGDGSIQGKKGTDPYDTPLFDPDELKPTASGKGSAAYGGGFIIGTVKVTAGANATTATITGNAQYNFLIADLIPYVALRNYDDNSKLSYILSYDISTGAVTLDSPASANALSNTQLKLIATKTIATGTGSIAFGAGAQAKAAGAIAVGSAVVASGTRSVATGQNNKATGASSRADGMASIASGSVAHAEGQLTVASGAGSHAEGVMTEATNSMSHAEGRETKSSGYASHSEGKGTIANAKCQHALGEYNIADTPADANSRGNYVEIVGNGTGDNARSNARTLDWEGNERLAGGLTVSSTGITIGSTSITEAQLQQVLALLTS